MVDLLVAVKVVLLVALMAVHWDKTMVALMVAVKVEQLEDKKVDE